VRHRVQVSGAVKSPALVPVMAIPAICKEPGPVLWRVTV
jgi:hypothetical protein